MKNLLKNKKVIIGAVVFIILVLIVGIVLIFNNNKGENNKDENSKETTYTMYVKINPLVKIVFKEVKYKCDSSSKYCTKLEGVDYELLNNDAKDIYNNIDFNNKDIYEIVGLLCKTARDNGIAFESINITTDYNFDLEDFKEEMKNNSKYEFNTEVNIDIKELLNEQEIVNQDLESNDDIQSYTVTFDSDGGSDITKQVVKENDKVNEPSKPTRTGYKFVEWQLNGKKYDFNSEVTKDITLKAKWEKETNNKPSENNKPNTENNKPSTNTETKPNTEEKPSETTKPTEETPKIESTIDKINLNENILVEIDYGGMSCGGYHIFSTNLKELFPQMGNGTTLWVTNLPGEVSTSEFESKENQINYDETMENQAESQLKSLSSKKIPGISDFHYSRKGHEFTYSYGYMSVSSSNKSTFKTLSDSLEKNHNQVKNIFKSSYGIMFGGCGSVPEPTLLTEDLCNEYNLTCSRW